MEKGVPADALELDFYDYEVDAIEVQEAIDAELWAKAPENPPF